MKAMTKRLINCILCGTLVLGMLAVPSMDVYADRTINEVQESIDHQKEVIEGINDEIDALAGEQDILLEQMDDLNAEIINMMTSIGMLTDEIAQKEKDIKKTQQEYEAAKNVEEQQREAMKVQVKMMYEGGKTSWFNQIIKSSSFGDILNNLTYTESVLDYNNHMLDKYETAKNQVHDLWDRLEAEKKDLQTQKKELEDQKKYCDELMKQLKAQSDNYDALIASAEKEAKAAQKLLQAEQKELKKLKDAEKRRQEEERKRQEALNKTYETTSYTQIVDNAGGSEIGKKIAKYGLQYVGNKYVYGGTSLTNGVDCSGFTYRVYEAFGYSLPRTSYAQRSSGKAVDYANAQPGDLIMYSGHVGIYIGGGYIVHASSSKPYPQGGIKVNKATYREIIGVRRIVE
ncbi:MAG: C40 family peptidase [Lachnospiraceae bacterium]|nr:C40 family peptidase [Lachnospiraceae bacterium]